ncbi:MAG: hypothetical protein J2P34_01730, partial [Actinobacteria bacterium]|nr:hypothetical protein [Actinomycetota bacterium]
RPRLRLGARRSADGVVGGSIATMLGRRRSGLAGYRAATPRFRSGSSPAGLGGRRGGFGGGLTGMLPGARARRVRLGRAGRRAGVWPFRRKRTGGL